MLSGAAATFIKMSAAKPVVVTPAKAHHQTNRLSAAAAAAAALAAGACVRGMLLPFALLVATERSGLRTLASRAASSLAFGALAVGLSAARTLHAALLGALVAALIGLAGGIKDDLALLTASTFISTLSYAALPLAQAVSLSGIGGGVVAGHSAAEVAKRLGLLSAVDALASATGVQASFSGLGAAIGAWGDGGLPAVVLCTVAAVVAVIGRAALGYAAGDEKDGWLSFSPSSTPTTATTKPASASEIDASVTRLTMSVFALAAAVTVPATFLQRSVEALPHAPTAVDRCLDAALRLSVQAIAAPWLIAQDETKEKDGPLGDLGGPKGVAILGCFVIAVGAVIGKLFGGPDGSMSAVLQRGTHHLMTSGLYLTETAAATLVALAAGRPSALAISLVSLHTLTTLGPALLPLVGTWVVGGGALASWAQLLLPVMLVSLVPSMS